MDNSRILEQIHSNTTPKLLKLKGYSSSNISGQYFEAKEPLQGSGWTSVKNEDDLKSHLSQRGWIGCVVPRGFILIDIDDSACFTRLYEKLRIKKTCLIAIKTPNGGQLIFR